MTKRRFHPLILCIVISSVGSGLLASSTRAYAQSSVTGSGGTIIVDSSGSSESGSPGGISSSVVTKTIYYNGWPVQETVPVYHVYTPVVIEGSPNFTNEPCLAITASQPLTSYWEAYQLQNSALLSWETLAETYPGCIAKSTSTTPSIKIDPSQVVTQFWNQTVVNDLPSPQISIPPGFALSGLPSFLTANCSIDKTFYDQTPLGTATINAHGKLWVKWTSNETWSGPYDSCGLPWPNGTISHVFTTKGNEIVSVKETWTASWSLAGHSGNLGGLYTRAKPLDLPIYSISSQIYF